MVWGISRTIELTGDAAHDAWRRHLGLMLDGFRADPAHPLPFAPIWTPLDADVTLHRETGE